MGFWDLIDDLRGPGFEHRLVQGRVLDTGPQAKRAIGITERLNEVRHGRPKHAVLVWSDDNSAITCRGQWIYISVALAQRLTDGALAFVVAHEMSHHDLEHLTIHMRMAGLLGSRHRMELDADRRAMVLCRDAGFPLEQAVEAMNPVFWDEPKPAPHPTPSAEWWDKRLTSHPSMHERYAAMNAWIARQTR